MAILVRANSALQKCENELRELGIEALRGSEYDLARRLTELAEAVADRRVRAGLVAPADVPSSPLPSRNGKQPRRAAAMPAGTLRRARSGEYPRFVRNGDQLVKVGWSKKAGEEYEHKAALAAVRAFAEHVRTRTRAGRIWTVDELMPVRDPGHGGDLPPYQVYLIVAWLRSTRLIEKRGRDGYVVGPDGLDGEIMDRKLSAVASQGL